MHGSSLLVGSWLLLAVVGKRSVASCFTCVHNVATQFKCCQIYKSLKYAFGEMSSVRQIISGYL